MAERHPGSSGRRHRGRKSEKQLEVIAEVTPEQKKEMKDFLKNVPIQVDAWITA